MDTEDGTQVAELFIEDQAVKITVFVESGLETREEDKRVVTKETSEQLVRFGPSSKFIWVSVDKENHSIRVGHGYTMVLNTIATLTLNPEESDHTISRIRTIGIPSRKVALVKSPKCVNLPVILDPPPVIMDKEVTLELLSLNSCITSSMLPKEAQYLYGAISGRSVRLSEEDAAAINYSYFTEGMTLYKKAKEKSGCFGNNPDMVYIRVTIGPNRGDSPGSPYVMELWPPGKKSPIHHHSWAVAIVKILHGEIHSRYFNPIANRNAGEPKPIAEYVFTKGQITYLTPEFYQTHQLENKGKEVCATLQCYRYLDNDVAHYEFFDYIDEEKEEAQRFEPDSDFEYLDLMKIVRTEYSLASNKQVK